jgi:hypothetical protein
MAKSIELSFPSRAVIADPLFNSPKSRSLYAASAYSAQLLSLY